jgi:hypothetical protein
MPLRVRKAQLLGRRPSGWGEGGVGHVPGTLPRLAAGGRAARTIGQNRQIQGLCCLSPVRATTKATILCGADESKLSRFDSLNKRYNAIIMAL